jgi:hypothetical protein
MSNRYKDYEYSYAIAVCIYGNMAGWVNDAEYDDIDSAFDALVQLTKPDSKYPLDAKYGQHYRIELKYKKVKDEIKT